MTAAHERFFPRPRTGLEDPLAARQPPSVVLIEVMQNWWLCFPLALGLSGVARAQGTDVPAFNAQSYRPPVDSRATLWTDDAGLAATNSWTARMSLGYAKHVLSVTSARSGKTLFLVDDIVQVDLLGGYTIGRFRLGLDLPIYPLVTSEVVDGQAGLGDVGLDLRGTLVDPGDGSVGLALATRITGPTTTVDLPLGAGGLGYEASAILDLRMSGTLAAINLGYRGVPAAALDDFTIDDQVIARIGLGVPLGESFGLSADVAGNLQLNQPLDNAANGAWEGLGGFWSRMDRNWVMRAGTGGGLTEGIGTPMVRAVFMVGYEPLPDGDSDGDGFVDSIDPCPDKAEDMDGWEDSDGCPEEASPVRVLMRDPYGNPVDEAIVQIKTDGGEPIHDGGPQFMVGLKPGVYIIEARADGFDPLDEEFVVKRGKAQDLIKAMNPIKPPPPVRVTKKAIRITQKVYFETAKAKLMPTSHGILNLIAQTMAKHPEILKVRVVGHTDSRADEAYNQKLSEARAESVRKYLVSRGVDAARLEAVGMGESQPLDPRDNKRAYDLNRRVEFVIMKRK